MHEGVFMKTKLINTFLSLVLLVGLAGCGGGGGSGGSPQTENENTALPVTTVIKGFYSGTLGSKELISVVTPDLDFFALHFRSLNNPDIYSGKLSLGMNGVANATNAGLLAYVGGVLNPKPGTAALTGASLHAFTGIFNVDSQLPLNFAVTAPLSSAYPILQGTLQGPWSGIWSDGLSLTGVSNPFTIAISSSGNMELITAATVNSCELTASIMPIAGVNIFSVAMIIPVRTGCVRTVGKQSGVVLNGVAVIYKSPDLTKTWRLDLVAVDALGSGMSFRGDR